jgi:hypothetical protein
MAARSGTRVGVGELEGSFLEHSLQPHSLLPYLVQLGLRLPDLPSKFRMLLLLLHGNNILQHLNLL